jgi:uncharacterized protein YlxP (DUF503 family)
MSHLFVGVGQVSVNLRQSQTLKDKRRYLNSVEQRLKNLGFSVTQCGFSDSPKRGMVGFVLAGAQHGAVERMLAEGIRLFGAEAEITDSQTDVFDYSENVEEKLFSFLDQEENEG